MGILVQALHYNVGIITPMHFNRSSEDDHHAAHQAAESEGSDAEERLQRLLGLSEHSFNVALNHGIHVNTPMCQHCVYH